MNVIKLSESKTKPHKGKKTCKHHLGFYSSKYSLFSQCTLNNGANPVQFCEGCYQEYSLLIDAFSTFKHEEDSVIHKKCTDIYFDKDQLNLIETLHGQVTGIWGKANCDECHKYPNDTQTAIMVISALEDCINKTPDFCKECSSKYLEAEETYKELSAKVNGKMCFDILDVKNKTNSKWSEKCKKEAPGHKLTGFTALSTCLVIIQALFYGGFVIIGKRYQNDNISEESGNEPPPARRNTRRIHGKSSSSNKTGTDTASDSDVTDDEKALKKEFNEDKNPDEIQPIENKVDLNKSGPSIPIETSEDEMVKEKQKDLEILLAKQKLDEEQSLNLLYNDTDDDVPLLQQKAKNKENSESKDEMPLIK